MAGKPKHGMSRSPEYQAWADMKVRCYNNKNKRYKDYGGRGIRVCDRWLNSFENFYEDMGPRPSPDHSLERKENNGDYCPENCYWAIWDDQYNNRRRCYYITYKGRTQTLTQWAKEFNINPTTLNNRIHGEKWDIEKAFTTPIKPAVMYLNFQNRVLSMTEWSKETGIELETIRARLNRGWSIEEALTKPVKGK